MLLQISGELNLHPPQLLRWVDLNCRNCLPDKLQIGCGCKDGGCTFWEWLDPKPTDHQIEILVDLRDAVKALRTKNQTLEVENSELSYLLDEAQAKIAQLVTKNEKATVLARDQEAKIAELVKEKEKASVLAKDQEAKEVQGKLVFSKVGKACCRAVIFLVVCLALLVAMFSKGPETMKPQLL